MENKKRALFIDRDGTLIVEPLSLIHIYSGACNLAQPGSRQFKMHGSDYRADADRSYLFLAFLSAFSLTS